MRTWPDSPGCCCCCCCCYLLLAACCLLHAACCMLHVACCMLHVASCLLRVARRENGTASTACLFLNCFTNLARPSALLQARSAPPTSTSRRSTSGLPASPPWPRPFRAGP